MIHEEAHPLAGKVVWIKESSSLGKAEYILEDWWDRVGEKSWMVCNGNPACLNYAARSSMVDRLPIDDNVVYGKIGPFGHLIHVSELETV